MAAAAEAAATTGIKRSARAKLINTIDDVLAEIQSISCDDWGCSKIVRAEMSFQSLSGFYSPPDFYKLRAEVFEETMPLTCSAVASSCGQAIAGKTSSFHHGFLWNRSISAFNSCRVSLDSELRRHRCCLGVRGSWWRPVSGGISATKERTIAGGN